MLTRRSLLPLLFAAPAIVRYASLMPVKVYRPLVAFFTSGEMKLTDGQWHRVESKTMVLEDDMLLRMGDGTIYMPGGNIRLRLNGNEYPVRFSRIDGIEVPPFEMSEAHLVNALHTYAPDWRRMAAMDQI